MTGIKDFDLIDENYKFAICYNLKDEIKLIEAEKYNKKIKGWNIEIYNDLNIIVAKTNKNIKIENIKSLSFDKVQMFLDIIVLELKIINKIDKVRNYVLYYKQNDKNFVEVNFQDYVNIKSNTSVKLVIKDKNTGKVVEKKEIGHPNIDIYNDSFRYYRMSKLFDNPVDCFRNLYLAFEQILGTISPRNNQREWNWIEKTLQLYSKQKELTQILKCYKKNIPKKFQKEIYSVRCSLFHSKINENFIMPSDSNKLEKVEKSLYLLELIYLSIVREFSNNLLPRGGIVKIGLDNIAKKLYNDDKDNLSIIICNSKNKAVESLKLEDELKYKNVIKKANSNLESNSVKSNIIFDKRELIDKIKNFGAINNQNLLSINSLNFYLITNNIDELKVNLSMTIISDDIHKQFT